jgi:hypothetical protein
MIGFRSSALTVEASPSINPARINRTETRTEDRKSFMDKKKRIQNRSLCESDAPREKKPPDGTKEIIEISPAVPRVFWQRYFGP